MVKKMFQLQQYQSNESVRLSNLVNNSINENVTEIINQVSQSNNIDNQDNQNNVPDNLDKQPNIQFHNSSQTSSVNHVPSYRFISYPISNKKYRLVSIIDSEQPQDINEEQFCQNQERINLNNDDFRQPLNNTFPTRRNPFGRFNFGNNHMQGNVPLNQNNNQRHRNLVNRHKRLTKRGKPSFSSNNNHSLVNYAKKLYQYIKSVELKSWLQYLPFCHPTLTLQSKYKFISLVILNNSINLQNAIVKALEYNIPLMQVIMNPQNCPGQEQIVLQKILKNFTIAHFVNQNFVLYGDWSYDDYREFFVTDPQNNPQQNRHNSPQSQPKEGDSRNRLNFHRQLRRQQHWHQPHPHKQSQGRIVFRKGQKVFAQIDLSYIDKIDHNQLQQKLLYIRDYYYRHNPIQSPHKATKPSDRQKTQQQSRRQQQQKTQQQTKTQTLGLGMQLELNRQTQKQTQSEMQNNVASNLKVNDVVSSGVMTVGQIQQQILQEYLGQRMKEQIRRKQINDIAQNRDLKYDYDYHEENSYASHYFENNAGSGYRRSQSREIRWNNGEYQFPKQTNNGCKQCKNQLQESQQQKTQKRQQHQ